MRILKKSLALLLAVAMMTSLVVVNVFADSGPTITLGSARGKAGEIVTLDVTMTNNPGFVSFKANYASTSEKITVTGAKKDQNTGLVPFGYQGNGSSTIGWADGTAEENCVVNGVVCRIQFQIAADATPGEYPINLTFVSSKNVDMQSITFTAVGGVITVYEENWISSTAAVELGEVMYGANAPVLPDTVKGIGVTSRGVAIEADDEPGVVLDVEWGTIDTFVAPEEGLSVAGTVTTEEDEVLKYKDSDGEVVAVPGAIANYTIAKSTAGVVAPVKIDVEARLGGTEADVAAIVALDEIKAVANTTIAIDGGETEEVTLNWTAAEPANAADATLNLGTTGESIVLNVPLADTATYYDLDGKVAAVTITVKDAVKMYNEIEAVTVETEVEYGASAPVLPKTVIGLGQTAGGQEITAEYGDALTVVWDAVDTFQAPGTKTVNGTVAEPDDALISFKNADYTADVDTLTATANYTIIKSTKGVVAPVATIDVRAKDAGAEADVAAIIALDEIKAVANTTIAIEGGETETVTLNWADAELADEADATLNLGSDSDSIVLVVPVTGDTTYYDLDSKSIAVTIQMIPAWEYGDVNHDKMVDDTDIIYLTRYYFEWPGYGPEEDNYVDLNMADVYKDGIIDDTDIIYLTRHYFEWPGYQIIPMIPENE